MVALYGSTCHLGVGAIVEVGEKKVSLLQLDGHIRRIPIDRVKLIARYHVLENPFPKIVPTDLDPISKIQSESSEGSFFGYATNFYENLVLFLDTDGKIRVVEESQIVAIHREAGRRTYRTKYSRPLTLAPPIDKTKCGAPTGLKPPAEPQLPSQVIADSLRISAFWAGMHEGYIGLEGLRERTHFYARPVLVDKKSRLGLVYQERSRNKKLKLQDTADDLFPLYFSFGGGDPYRFQSALTMGEHSYSTTPIMTPLFGMQSQFKSHLLHGELIANFSGFSAGTSIFDQRFLPRSDVEDRYNSPYALLSFNHMTLLGADYGPWSLSYGYYFPVFGLGKGNEFREIIPDETSPVIRLRYQDPAWKAAVHAYFTDSSGDIDPPPSSVTDNFDSFAFGSLYKAGFENYHTETTVPESAKIRFTAVRFNFDWLLDRDTLLQANMLYGQLSFKESGEFLRTNTPTQIDNRLEQTRMAIRTYARMDLGEWVAIGGEAVFEHNTTKGTIHESLTEPEKMRREDFVTAVAMMELLL